MNPILKYRGGKSKEIPRFLDLIPENFDRYIEPFFGGGALFFYLEPEKSIINDINSKLINFYNQLRNDYDFMRIQLDALQNLYEKNQNEYQSKKNRNPELFIENGNEKLYYELRDEYNHPTGKHLESVVYFFINKTAYSGMIRHNRNGEYNVPFGRYPNFNTKLITKAHSTLLQKAEVNGIDYSEIFSLSQPNDFMFLDPPYDCVFTDYGNIDMMNGFDKTQHARLANNFRKLPCKALMIIGKTALTEGLYKEYIVDEYIKNYSVNIRNRFKAGKTHIIVKNY